MRSLVTVSNVQVSSKRIEETQKVSSFTCMIWVSVTMDLRAYGFLVTLALTVVSIHLHLNVGASGICEKGSVSKWVSQNHFDILSIYASGRSSSS